MRRSAVVVILTLLVRANCFFGWFASNPVPLTTPATEPKDFTKDGTVAVVPFEMKTADDEFLQEGKKYGLQLSTLDVLLGLTSSCSQLNEEDLGKLSVRLLNCQSAVEGRPTFPCTDEMSLRQCTQGMDQHTWNTYHLISNRARAVCYSTRQQQFYAKTEMTVNKLVWTTDQQVKAMSQLEQEQQKVSALTSQTLETMSSGQKALMQQQEKLKSSQQSVQNFVAENLKELMLEKALIAAGQRELAHMTNTIRKKLDAASTMMLSNEQQRQGNHRELLKDLKAVQDYAKFLQERLEQTTREVLDRQETAAVRFEETLDNLGKINASIGYVQEMVNTMRKDVDSKFGWLVRLLHSTGGQLSAIYCCVLHCCYLLVAMFLAAFLHFPMPSRLFLLFIVPTNAVASVRESCGLDFGPLTVLLAIFVAGSWRRSSRMSAAESRSSTPLLEERQSTPPVSDTEQDENSASVSRWLLRNAGAAGMPDVVPATSTPAASPEDPFLHMSRKENGHTVKQNLLSSFERRSLASFRDSPDRRQQFEKLHYQVHED
ncbi:hypothetical protein HPB50_018675 [Hyalomma asiaticum]|uniref:Uncharacterized protein n=1 Tax=Hyalomma asiaticum TaxID=266040 RepID=A0ACB7SML6_HYAAI|nr:hypothetical protein HPB50_018675 [Hyalomma asiaticum]